MTSNAGKVDDAIDTCPTLALYATRTTIRCTLNTAPGALVFHCGMILRIQILNDWNLIRNCKQSTIDKNHQRQNACCIQEYDYQIGQQVLILPDSKRSCKLAPTADGM